MLTTLGPDGWETLRQNPERILAVRDEVEALGLKVVAQYALMGQYDFLNVIEAPDEPTMARAAIMLAAAPYPTLRLERRLWEAGDGVVIGLDEVGRGSWAGPVTVGAVVAPDRHLKGVRDSKMLTPAERDRCAVTVRDWALACGVGH